MSRLHRSGAIAGAIVWLATAALHPAPAQMPVSSEFQVNAHTVGYQIEPDIGLDAEGDFVVVWTSPHDGSRRGVFGRRFTSAGTPLATEFQINSHTASQQVGGALTVSASGAFVVSWASGEQDGSSEGIFARRFSAAGKALAAEFQVNTFTTGAQQQPKLAAAADGDFVAVWEGGGSGDASGIFGRRFDSAGKAQGVEFRVNSTTVGAQSHSAIDVAPSGEFVVAWSSPDGSGYGVFAQRFTSAGAAVGSEFVVNTNVANLQSYPAVAIDGRREVVIVWTSLQNGSTTRVFARRFDSSGRPAGAELQVDVDAGGDQLQPAAALDGAGDLVIVWDSSRDAGTTGLFAQQFKGRGGAASPARQVNTYVAGAQYGGAIAAHASGDFVVVWTSALQDGSGYGVFGRRFEAGAGSRPGVAASPQR